MMDQFNIVRSACISMCCNSVVIPSGHMISIASVHPGEGSSSVALLKVSLPFIPRERINFFFGEFFLIRCEVLGHNL